MSTNTTLISPLDGTVVALEKVPDPVFSKHMLGNGLAIFPTSQTVFAPLDGIITNINAAKHALVIKHGNIEVLIHVGLESVTLQGEGFVLFAQEGQTVSAGQKLLSFDLNILSKKATSPLVMLVITSPAEATITPLADESVKTGLPLFSVSGANHGSAVNETLASTEVIESAPMLLNNPSGLHARPAAMLAAIAAQYNYMVELCQGRQCANVKSIVGLMGLGLRTNDLVIFRVYGPKNQAVPLLVKLEEAFQSALGNTQTKQEVAEKDKEQVHGICACGGMACGKAFLLKNSIFAFEEESANPVSEREALDNALHTLGEQMKKRLAEEKDTVTRDILNAHLLLLKDPLLASTTYQMIEKGKTAAFAFNSAIRRSVDILKQTQNSFLMERIADLKDLRREVLCQLTGQRRRALAIPTGSIIIAEELLPSDVSALPDGTAGVILVNGSPTSHAGILLRNRNIPSLVRAGKHILSIPLQTTILLNADTGDVILNPSPEQQKQFEERLRQTRKINQQDLSRAHEPATTQDKIRIYVEGNTAKPEEAARAYAAGAEGIGLVRTEFLFQDRPFSPSEEEQRATYQAILDTHPGHPVTFRLLDSGGDKPMPFINIAPEENPIVGVRGVRALKNNEAFFRTQLRALLRLTPQRRVRIMLPMITFVEETQRFRKILNQEAVALGLKETAQLGIMVEVPAVALQSRQFAPHVDFFSIGTNDLTQYTLAIDRNHKELSPLADALHPAVLRLIAQTCAGALENNKPVAVCGALASEPDAIAFLIGLGITHLAVSSGMIARTKAIIRQANFQQCRELAHQALQQTDATAVRKLLKMEFAI